jgi:hypothetical protein
VAAPVEGEVSSFVAKKVDDLKTDLLLAVDNLQCERNIFGEKLKVRLTAVPVC